MSKIINKKQLDFLIESTIKEYDPKEYKERESHIGSMYQGNNPKVMADIVRDYPEYASDYDFYLSGGGKYPWNPKSNNPNEPSEPCSHCGGLGHDEFTGEECEWCGGSSDEKLKSESYMKDGMCECGAMMYEGICEAGCGSQMEEGNWMEEGDYMEEEDGVSYKKSGLEHPKLADRDENKRISRWELSVGKAIEKNMKEDYVGESVKDLAEAVTKTFNPSFLTEDMDNFKKLINYKNK